MNCLHAFRTKHKVESDKKVCEDKDFCDFVMLSEDIKILEFKQYQKFVKNPSVIHTDLES